MPMLFDAYSIGRDPAARDAVASLVEPAGVSSRFAGRTDSESGSTVSSVSLSAVSEAASAVAPKRREAKSCR
jgi:hypothetical protein